MTTASIPVDLLNPGQVFASLGFLEAANVCCSRVTGKFDWADEENIRFVLDANSDGNPFEVVLEFLAKAELHRIAPPSYKDPQPNKKKTKKAAQGDEEETRCDDLERSDCFPARKPDRMTLPVCLHTCGACFEHHALGGRLIEERL